MRKTELLDELQKSIDAYGDGEVFIQDGDGGLAALCRMNTSYATNDKIHDSNYEFAIIY